jgi:hypothetical protein
MNFSYMHNRYTWQDKYEAAILETNDGQLKARMAEAQTAINARIREIQSDHGGTQEERQALIDAIYGLRTLRDNVS